MNVVEKSFKGLTLPSFNKSCISREIFITTQKEKVED